MLLFGQYLLVGLFHTINILSHLSLSLSLSLPSLSLSLCLSDSSFHYLRSHLSHSLLIGLMHTIYSLSLSDSLQYVLSHSSLFLSARACVRACVCMCACVCARTPCAISTWWVPDFRGLSLWIIIKAILHTYTRLSTLGRAWNESNRMRAEVGKMMLSLLTEIPCDCAKKIHFSRMRPSRS